LNHLDIDKVKKAYSDLGLALEIEPHCVTIEEKKMPYRENSLSEKEKLVFTYIREHPGISKEEVVNSVKNYSRVTILKTIKGLADDGLIFDKKDENNSKRHHLFINSKNELASLNLKLDSFRESYFSLLDKIQLLEDNIVSNMPFHDKSKLIEALVLPFKAVMLLIQYDLFGHIEKVPNKYLVEKKANAAYEVMRQIHSKLYKNKILKMLIEDGEEEILIHLFMNTANGLSPGNIKEIWELFKKLGMGKLIEKLIDSLWDMSYLILPFVDLHYSYKRYDVETIKNWRKVISEFDSDVNKNKPIHVPHY
jgi:DNA-binding MarR family transcriptional regulator